MDLYDKLLSGITSSRNPPSFSGNAHPDHFDIGMEALVNWMMPPYDPDETSTLSDSDYQESLGDTPGDSTSHPDNSPSPMPACPQPNVDPIIQPGDPAADQVEQRKEDLGAVCTKGPGTSTGKAGRVGDLSQAVCPAAPEGTEDTSLMSRLFPPREPGWRKVIYLEDFEAMMDAHAASQSPTPKQAPTSTGKKKGKGRAEHPTKRPRTERTREASISASYTHPLHAGGWGGKTIRVHQILYSKEPRNWSPQVIERCVMTWIMLALMGPGINIIEYTLVSITYILPFSLQLYTQLEDLCYGRSPDATIHTVRSVSATQADARQCSS